MEGKKSKSLLLPIAIMLLATVVAVGIRVYQLLNITVQSSGFYTDSSNWSVITLNLICLAVCVFAVIMGLVFRKEKLNSNTNKSIFVGTAAIIFAITLLIDFVMQAVNIFELYANFNNLLPLKTYLYQSGIVPMAFQGVFALISALFFGAYALKRYGSSLDLKFFKLAALAPSIWFMCRMIVHFMCAINYLNVSQRFFEMISIAFGMIFFYNFAKSLFKIGDKQSYAQHLIFGIPLAFFAILISLPRLILTISGSGGLLVASDATVVADLMIGIFVVSKLFDER